MKLRLLKKTDIPAAAAIVRRNYSSAHARSATEELREMFGSAAIKPLYIVAEDTGKIVGFAGCMQSWMDYDVYTIFWVNVLPDYQKQGIGKALVARVIAILAKKHPAMILLTTTVPDFYEKHFGFRIIDRLPKRYSLMALRFKK